MENANVKELIKEIKGNESQRSSVKDEVRVMKEMLNDRSYKVDVYGAEGKIDEFCPAQEARTMISSIISSAAKIPQAEAEELAEAHEFKKAEAASMVNISKEFVNTYLDTGRKLPLGGREDSDISIIQKEIEAKSRPYPKKIGIDENGKGIYETDYVQIQPHKSARVIGPCPKWKQGK